MVQLLARFSAAKPIYMLIGVIAVGVGCAAIGIAGISRYEPIGLEAPNTESGMAQSSLAAELGYDPEAAVLLSATAENRITAPDAVVALDAIESRALALDGVEQVNRSAPDPDGRMVLLALHLGADVDADRRLDVVDSIQRTLDPGPLRVQVGGRLPGLIAARQAFVDEIPGLALLAAPVLFLLIVLGTGTRLAVGPILTIGAALAIALSALRMLDWIADPRLLTVATVAVVAIIVAVESAVMISTRFGEFAPAFGAGEGTARQTIQAALPPLVVTALVGGLVGGVLLLGPIAELRSAGVGMAIATPAAAVAALLIIPPILMLAGSRPPDAIEPVAGSDGEGMGSGVRFRGGRLLGTAIVAAGIAASVVLAVPLLSTGTIGFTSSELPAETEPLRAEQTIRRGFGAGASEPVLSVLPGGGRGAIYGRAVAEQPGISLASEPRSVGALTLIESRTTAAGGSLAAQATTQNIRGITSAPRQAKVGGLNAALVDARHSMSDRLPLIALLIVGLVAILSFALSRGLLTFWDALLAPLPALCGIGAVVLIFGDGRLTSAFDYAPAGGPHLGSLLAVGACVVTLTVVRTASRGAQGMVAMRLEAQGQSDLSLAFVAGHRARTAELVGTGVGVVIGAVLLASVLLPVKEFGLGLAVGLLVDLLILRIAVEDGFSRLALSR